MRISDWSADVCSSDLDVVVLAIGESTNMSGEAQSRTSITVPDAQQALAEAVAATGKPVVVLLKNGRALALEGAVRDAAAIVVTWFLGSESGPARSDEHTSELQSLMRISYPVFCLKKKNNILCNI